MQRAGVFAVVMLVVLAVRGEAWAQPDAAAEGVPPDVLALLRRGVDARTSGDDAAALALFAEARTLAPTLGRVAAQLGIAHQALEHWREAEPLLEQALASDDPWIGRNREALETSLGAVRAHLATLEVRANDGAEITLDDDPHVLRADATGASPTRFRVTEGAHHLRAHLPGHEDRELEIVATPGETTTVVIVLVASVSTGPEEPPVAPIVAVPEGGAPTPHALVWAGTVTTVVGLAAAITLDRLAADALASAQADVTRACVVVMPTCEAHYAARSADLANWEIAVNVAWALTAVGGVLSAVGIGLSLSTHDEHLSAELTPLGARLRW